MFHNNINPDEILFSLGKNDEEAHALVRDETFQEVQMMAAASGAYSCKPVQGCANAALLNTLTETVVSCHQTKEECEDAKSRISSGSKGGYSSSSSEEGCYQDATAAGMPWAGSGCPEYSIPTNCHEPITFPDGTVKALVYMAYQTNEVDTPGGCMRVKCMQPEGLEGTNAQYGANLVDNTNGEFCCGVVYYQDSDGNLVMECP